LKNGDTVFKYLDTVVAYLSIYLGLAQTYENFNYLDSVLKYAQIVTQVYTKKFGKMKWPAVPYIFGNIYSKKREFSKALQYYHLGLGLATYKGVMKDIMDICVGIAETFRKMDKTDSSIFYANKVLDMSRKVQYPMPKLAALNLLANIYKSKQNLDSTSKYLEFTIATKESLLNEQKIMEIQNLSFNETLREIEKQEAIAKENRKKMIIVIISFIAIIVIAFLVWNRIKQLKTEHKMIDLEAKALRAQMNPHFIFNCMNSIKSLI
jgi:hypothetical protein